MLGYKDGERVRLVSRHGVDHTARFAQLAVSIAQLQAPTLILDGEVCVFDANLVSQFHLLGDENHGTLATPPVYIAFAALFARGRDLRPRALRDRRTVLDEIHGAKMVFASLRLDGDGVEAWNQVKRNGWEGMVAKDCGSRHGGRTRSWQKIKVRHEGRFLVIGLDMAEGYGSSLLLAARRGRVLSYVGAVQWGATRSAAEHIVARSRRRIVSACPDAEGMQGVTWIEKRVLVEVSYSELMLGRLRDPVLRRMIP